MQEEGHSEPCPIMPTIQPILLTIWRDDSYEEAKKILDHARSCLQCRAELKQGLAYVNQHFPRRTGWEKFKEFAKDVTAGFLFFNLVAMFTAGMRDDVYDAPSPP